MKGYLGLVSEYAKVHKKKNRLTIICIAISVMLVTAIFGMADMSLKAQKEEAIRRYGNWHTIISNIPLETADAISNRKDVSVSGFLGMASSTTYQGKELGIRSNCECPMMTASSLSYCIVSCEGMSFSSPMYCLRNSSLDFAKISASSQPLAFASFANSTTTTISSSLCLPFFLSFVLN